MNNNVYILEDRAILYIHGEDSKIFLQNLISNDINKVNDNTSCFASLLTPQGKFLYEFIIVKHKLGFFIDCEKSQAENLLKQLNAYKIRSKIEILNLSNEFVVASLSFEKFLTIKNSKNLLGFTLRFREDPIILDPRNKELGARLIINLEKLYLTLKKLGLKNDKIHNYYELSHKLGIVPKNLNKLQNKLFGIECNYENINGIDFKKGCYVGQENTARIKLKDKLSKRILPLKVIEGEINIDNEITQKGKSFGKVLIDKDYPFGLIKFRDENIRLNENFECGNAKIKILKPFWEKNN